MTEVDLNKYYNEGRFNASARIGCMMDMIRKLNPLTIDEWKNWYLKNVHDETYIDAIAEEMYKTIPAEFETTYEECRTYIYDVMFRRTFQGFNKERLALNYLNKQFTEDVYEAPESWDINFYIDFYIPKNTKHPLIGIQLKPETFFIGKYEESADIRNKLLEFKAFHNALVYVLRYDSSADNSGTIKFINPEIITMIQENL